MGCLVFGHNARGGEGRGFHHRGDLFDLLRGHLFDVLDTQISQDGSSIRLRLLFPCLIIKLLVLGLVSGIHLIGVFARASQRQS